MRIKDRQQMLAVVAIAAVALLAGDRLILSPMTHAWEARSKRIVELRKQIEDGSQLLRREPGIRSRWEQMRRNTLPNDTSAAEQRLHQAIDRWAQESRVTITAITPQWKHDADDFMTYHCRVEASGNLAAVSRFLYDVEKDTLALRLDAVEIGAHDKEGQQISLGLQLSGLVLISPTQ